MKKKNGAEASGVVSRGKTAVALVDDHPILREGLSHLISAEPDLEVCWMAADEEEAWQRLLQSRKPGIVIVDLSLPSGCGLDLIRRIKGSFPGLSVLVFSMHDQETYIERALKAGACGYVMKQEGSERILVAIRTLVTGGVHLSEYCSPALLKRLIGNGANTGTNGRGSSVEQLSDREFQVYGMVGRGKGIQEIAKKLNLSSKTVESHMAHIRKKLCLDDGRKLVHHAVGWVLSNESRLH